MFKDRHFKNWKYGMDASIELLLANRLYIKHRSELFKKHGNGWWYYWANPQGRNRKQDGHVEYMRSIIIDYEG